MLASEQSGIARVCSISGAESSPETDSDSKVDFHKPGSPRVPHLHQLWYNVFLIGSPSNCFVRFSNDCCYYFITNRYLY